MASTAVWCKARAALDECLGAGALSADDVAALAVVSQSQPLTVMELTCALVLSKAKTTRLLRRLIGLDLVAERVSPRDRRRSLLRMTPRGENILFEVRHSLDGTALDTALTGMRALREAARAGSAPDAPLAPGQALLLMACRETGALEVETLRGYFAAVSLPCPWRPASLSPVACSPYAPYPTTTAGTPYPHFAGHLSSCRSPSGMERCMGIAFMRL